GFYSGTRDLIKEELKNPNDPAAFVAKMRNVAGFFDNVVAANGRKGESVFHSYKGYPDTNPQLIDYEYHPSGKAKVPSPLRALENQALVNIDNMSNVLRLNAAAAMIITAIQVKNGIPAAEILLEGLS